MNFGLVGKKKSKDLIESAMLITIQKISHQRSAKSL